MESDCSFLASPHTAEDMVAVAGITEAATAVVVQRCAATTLEAGATEAGSAATRMGIAMEAVAAVTAVAGMLSIVRWVAGRVFVLILYIVSLC